VTAPPNSSGPLVVVGVLDVLGVLAAVVGEVGAGVGVVVAFGELPPQPDRTMTRSAPRSTEARVLMPRTVDPKAGPRLKK
jgi:hypothetical protein